MPIQTTIQNALLGALPAGDRSLLEPYRETVRLARGQVLVEAEGALGHAWFPQGCVVSCTIAMSDGRAVEAAMVGREGVVGGVMALGSRRPLARYVVLVEGAAARVTAERFEAAVARSLELRRLCLGHVETVLAQALRLSACHSLHSAEGRLCRWLLTVRDRAGGDELRVTHEGLAETLGLARPTVSLIAYRLQCAGLIAYRQGVLRVLYRDGLERGSCECYAALRVLQDHVLPALPAPPSGLGDIRVRW